MNARENDESVLIDFCLNQLEEPTVSEVRDRLQKDLDFRMLHQDISRSLGAVKLLPEYEPPADLVSRTLARIRQVRQTDALIAREELGSGTARSTFSLREALVMAASLLIVAFLFIPSVRQARRDSQIRQCGANMGQLGCALQSFASSNNQRLPGAGGQSVHWLPGSDATTSNSSALYKLVSQGYASSSLFVCPSVAATRVFRSSPEMKDFPGADTIHYSYQHAIGHDLSLNDPSYQNVKQYMVILGDNTPLYRNGNFDARQADNAVSDNHGQTGQNVLYLDMHVNWVKAPSAGVNGNNIYVREGKKDTYTGAETPAGATDSFLLPAYTVKGN